MRSLFRFIGRYYFFFLFLSLEVLSVFILVQKNSFHRARFIGFSRSVEGYFLETFDGLRDYFILREANEELAMENALLRNRLDALSRQQQESTPALPDSIPRRKFSFIPARIINNSTNKQYNYLTLNKGRNHGIEPEMAVISPRGVVGIVYAVSRNFATVLPLINRDFRLSARLKRTDYFGSLSWPGEDYRHAYLDEIPFHADLMKGDTVLTSGYSAIFPDGIPVGRVDEFSSGEGNFYSISVELAVDFKSLSHVKVIRNLLREEQLELERITGND